ADTRVLTAWALKILKQLYRPGFAYKKAGIMLTDLQSAQLRQGSLFDAAAANDERAARLMSTLDALNERWGKGVVRVATSGTQQTWAMRRERLSPSYTTNWDALPSVIAR